MNRVPLILAAVLAVSAFPATAQHPGGPPTSRSVVEGEDFRVYDADGRARSFADILAAMDDADAVLVGESHDDAVGHGVEAQLLIRAAERFGVLGEEAVRERPVVLSLEMFERDVQYIVDEYLEGLITEDQFRASARPWDNYEDDYRPMVEFARGHGVPLVAANAPRRYVNRVTRMGPESLDDLPEPAPEFLPPLPYPGPSERYEAQWNALMAEMMAQMQGGDEDSQEEEAPARDAEEPVDEMVAEEVAEEDEEAPPRHGMGYALQAQALWDAAMGHAVTRALDAHPGALVLHMAGSFHVERFTGIPERVADYRPSAEVVTVVLKPADDIDAWSDEDHEELGDFVVLTKAPAGAEASGG